MRNALFSTTAIAGLTAALALAPGRADATVKHLIATVTPNPATTSGLDWGGAGQSVSISTFNTNLGNLQSVMVVENLSANYSGKAIASTATSVSFTVTTNLTITGGPAVLDGTPALTLTSGGPVMATPSSPTYSMASGMISKTPSFGPSADWESTGAGTTTIALTSKTTPGATPLGTGIDVFPSLSFALGVTYTYTTSGTTSSVPEPASALMLGAGVLALGAARRRRKR